jgi:hypothetical protein
MILAGPVISARVARPVYEAFFVFPFAGGCSSGLMPAHRVLLATWLSPEPLLIKLFDLRSFIIG